MVKRERTELGEGDGVVFGEARDGGHCQRGVERRLRVELQGRDERDEAGADEEASGVARSVRRLRRRNGAVTFLKTANGRIETKRSSLKTLRAMENFFGFNVKSSWRKETLMWFLTFVGE